LAILLLSLVSAEAQNQRFVWRPNFTAQRQNIPPRVPTYEQYWQSRGSYGAGNAYYYGNQNQYQYQNPNQTPYGSGGYFAPSSNYPIYRPSTQYYQGSSYRAPSTNGLVTVHQFVHPYHGDQMLSLRPELEPALSEYVSEGAQFHLSRSPGAGMIPLHRFVDAAGMHSFTTSSAPPAGSRLEQVIGYLYAQQQSGTVPLYGWLDACCQRQIVSVQPQVDTGHELQSLGVLGYVTPC
jgi:hypothetical protein